MKEKVILNAKMFLQRITSSMCLYASKRVFTRRNYSLNNYVLYYKCNEKAIWYVEIKISVDFISFSLVVCGNYLTVKLVI